MCLEKECERVSFWIFFLKDIKSISKIYIYHHNHDFHVTSLFLVDWRTRLDLLCTPIKNRNYCHKTCIQHKQFSYQSLAANWSIRPVECTSTLRKLRSPCFGPSKTHVAVQIYIKCLDWLIVLACCKLDQSELLYKRETKSLRAQVLPPVGRRTILQSCLFFMNGKI